ncbi:zinc finger CCCH domain-containing protein 41-like [Bidens hawaiensis]|uniref:zinc finger CCCH domain-containing protein 41-like n=1 Tax=Bidens hawaiensis TaxID=980011 RepID=UPI00404AB5D8
MELRVSSRRPHMSHESYPDDKQISDDDDDRNHKHRRRGDTRCRLLEDEVTGHLYTKSYIKGSKSFQNGRLSGEAGSQFNETWKKYSFNTLDEEISVKFNQKGPQISRGFLDVKQKSRLNRSFSGHPGPVRGLATVSNSQGQSWNPFGLDQGIPNGGLDLFHPIGLQGTYRPSINSSLNMGLARQMCQDFEEQGFCLRGDMCPMEHGTNRIVVEDVQSLSHFNLPISLASANLSIAPVGTGPTPATSVVTNTLSNNKGPHGKNMKHGVGDIDSAADFYDPDQPLWSNDSHTSTGLQYLSHPNVGKNNSLLDHGPSGDHLVGQSDGSDDELVTSGRAVATLTTKSSLQGRITRKNRIFKATPSNFLQNETMSNRTQSGNRRMNRKPSQKAQLTLFVNGIPHQNNKRELLLSHFQKFGKVIGISIPLNSERAFVQFSKKEEAEAALMAPDAVMSNRFIKLFWANRDIIHDNQTVSAHGLKVSFVANKVLHNNKGSHAPVSAFDHPKPIVVEGKEVNPPSQKKLESLELLKEELRKKQEMLDQKRNDFQRKLAKLEKQATSPKGEVASEQLAKKQKLGILADSVKAASPSGGGLDAIVPSVQDEVAGTTSNVGLSGKQSFKTNLALVLPESSSLKSSSLSLVNLGSPVGNNRFKLDNRPTAFTVVPPLPDGLARVSVLKEHFAPYGDLSKVQVDDIDPKTSNVTAQIYFRTRHAAEKAFLGGKSWKGHNLQFVWLNSTDSRKDDVAKQTYKDSPKATAQQSYAFGDGDSENTKGAAVKDHMEPSETHQSNCISVAE